MRCNENVTMKKNIRPPKTNLAPGFKIAVGQQGDSALDKSKVNLLKIR